MSFRNTSNAATDLKKKVQFFAVMGEMGVEMLRRLLGKTEHFVLLPYSGVFCNL